MSSNMLNMVDSSIISDKLPNVILFIFETKCRSKSKEKTTVIRFYLFQFYVTLTIVLVLECLLSTLVFLFYTMPEFRQAVKVGPEEVLKKAVKDYFDDDAVRHWIDTVQKEVILIGTTTTKVEITIALSELI